MSPILRILAPLAFLAATSPAQAAEPLLTATVLTVERGDQTWAYLVWTSPEGEQLGTRHFSVYQKEGDAASSDAFSRVALVSLQTDPRAIRSLLDRARFALGEDIPAVTDTLTRFFQGTEPSGALKPEDLIAGLIQSARTDADRLTDLRLAARVYASLNLALGQAAVVPIPRDRLSTFEVRLHDPQTRRDGAVIARLTADPNAELSYIAPSVVSAAPEPPQAGFAHLSLRLRWDTPEAVRSLGPLVQGYNLYRVESKLASRNGWNSQPPPALLLSALASQPDSGVVRLNRAPITVERDLSPAEVMDASPGSHSLYHWKDDVGGFPETNPVLPGMQFYYFVTIRDLLSRDENSTVSPGYLGTFCDRTPPPIPGSVEVRNTFSFDPATESSNQRLQLRWEANPVTSDGKQTAAYLIYRWTSSDAALAAAGNPATGLVATVAHTNGQRTVSWIDSGTGAPSMPADAGRTFWYTIRAVDDTGGSCALPEWGGNLSWHSGPAFGVLRDRVGPDAPSDLRTVVLRPQSSLVEGTPAYANELGIDPNRYSVVATVRQTSIDGRLVSAEFGYETDSAGEIQARVSFGTDGVARGRLLLPLDTPVDRFRIRIRLISSDGSVLTDESFAPRLPLARTSVLLLPFEASVTYREEDATPGLVHVPPTTPQTGDGNSPRRGVRLRFTTTPTTVEWRTYLRYDDGPLTLVDTRLSGRQPVQPGDVVAGQALDLDMDRVTTPAGVSKARFYLQLFDINGNPSPLVSTPWIGVEGTDPLPRPVIEPLRYVQHNGTSHVRLAWLCPPAGVQSFEVAVSNGIYSPVLNQPQNATPSLAPSPAFPTVDSIPDNIRDGRGNEISYDVFTTPHVEQPGFRDGSLFTLLLPVIEGGAYSVRPVSPSGHRGPWAVPVVFPAGTAPSPQPPGTPICGTTSDIPWPQRGLPPLKPATELHPGVEALFLELPARGGHPAVDQAVVRIGIPEGLVYSPEGPFASFVSILGSTEGLLFDSLIAPASDRFPAALMPIVLYRIQMTSDLYPSVPGTVVQVSPMLEQFIQSGGTTAQGASPLQVRDPFVLVAEPSPLTRPGYFEVYLRDTTPVVSGARYAYVLVLHDAQSKEPVSVYITNPVLIP